MSLETMTAVQKLIIQDFAPGIRNALIEMEKTFSDIVDTSEGVYSDHMGTDWKVIHTYVTSVAGAIRAYSDAMGPASTVVRPDANRAGHLWTATPRTFPGVSETVAPTYMQRTVSLKEWLGSMHIPLQLVRAARLTTAIADGAAILIQQTARMVAQMKSNQFFAGSTYDELGTVSVTNMAGGTTSDAYATFALASGRIRRFQPGMLLAIYDSDGNPCRNPSGEPALVTAVDLINSKLTVYTSGGSNWGSGLEVDDLICLWRGSNAAITGGAGPSGLNDYLLASGTITPLSINLTYFPQFASQVTASLGAGLTESTLRKKLGAFMDAYGPSMFIDTLLMSSGVLNKLLSTLDNASNFAVRVYESQGRALSYRGGYNDDYEYVYDGKPVRIRTSAVIDSGTVYGLKLRNGNWKRYAPPRLPRAGSNDAFNRDIEFIAPQYGVNGIWMPTRYSDKVTEFAEAPFVSVEEYAPEQVQGIKISGVTEET